MKSSEAIYIIYKTTAKELGVTKAREMVAVTIDNIISDLESLGDVSAERIEQELVKEAEYFKGFKQGKVA